MKKIAFLVHQYGDEIVGGAEGYTRDLAEHLSRNYDVTVFTTTSIDYITWAPHYKADESSINGVTVKRYNVEKQREIEKFSEICNSLMGKLAEGQSTTVQEDELWINEEGPYCPELVADVKKSYNEYDLFVVVTYIYYIAVKCIPEIADKVLFISTAHDEPWINLSVFKKIFNMPRYFGFLTGAERDLVRAKFKNEFIPCEIMGTGIEIPQSVDDSRFRKKFNIYEDYIVYVGRLDASKGCDSLIEFFQSYKKKNKSDLKLVLIGKGQMQIPDNEDIIATGFVTDQEKYDAISGAFAMVTPSPYESLCIALLESMVLGVPVIANAKCQVLKEHCITSKAGLYYENKQEFIKILEYLRENKEVYQIMKRNGVSYVEERYTWDVVEYKIGSIIDELYNEKKMHRNSDKFDVENYKLIINNGMLIEPVYKDAITVVTASDNSYADYAGITVNSIIQNITDQSCYDILIFTNDMTDDKIRQILTLNKNNENVSIRFVYVNDVIESLNINISNNYKVVTYYRLLLQKLMEKYEKVIYMDSDVVVNRDLKGLWDVDIQGYLVAGTYDVLIAAWQNYDSGMQAYFEALGVNEPGKYLQAGVLVLNIKEMNQTFDKNYLLQEACRNHYIFADQDLINIACKGKIKYVDSSWDVLNLSDDGRNLCMQHLPNKLREELVEAEKNPKMIHYVEQSFPFFKNDRVYSNLYWKYVQKTVFYDKLRKMYYDKITENLCGKSRQSEETIKESKLQRTGSRVLNFLRRNNLLVHGKKDFIMSSVKINEHGIEKKMDKLILRPGDQLSGPNIFMSPGKHTVTLSVKRKGNKKVMMKVTAGARHILIGEEQIKEGKNSYMYDFPRNYVDVEIIIINTSEDDIIITEFCVY